MNVANVLKHGFYSAKFFLNKNLPSVLSGLAIVGVGTTTVFAVYATNKAKEDILEKMAEEAQTLEPEEQPNDLSRKEMVKLVWKRYIPTALSAATTVACIVGSNSVNLRKNAAIAGLYSITDTSLKEYKEKVVNEMGKRKEEKIRNEINQEKVNANPPKDGQIIMTGYGDTLCWDALSDRYFKSDLEKLRQIQNDLNYRLLSEMWISLNEVYIELGLNEIRLGYDLGWSVDHPVDFRFDAMLTPNGQPCIKIDYEIGPMSGTGWRD